MQVKIGNVVIPDAKVNRFIDIQGLPYSMINITYTADVDVAELCDSLMKNPQPQLPYESETLKTKVLINRIHGKEITLMESASEVGCGYQLKHFRDVNKKTDLIFIMPENVKQSVSQDELSKLQFISLILKRNVPKEYLENE